MEKLITNYIYSWKNKGYENGIPDEAPVRLEQLNKVPSYKQICKAILSNDLSLKSLGVNQIKSKHYHTLKKIELGIIDNQLKLKL